ncbi:MAG TPA: A24 family peptidase [Micromonosporaceae bacterium]
MFNPLWFAIGAVVGVAAGPVLRAAIFSHSVASGEPWRTHCPICDKALVRGNWSLLVSAVRPSGRCPACHTRVGPPIGSVEVVAAAVVGLLAGFLGPHPATLAFAWAGLVGVVLGAVDIAVHRLPDRLIAAGVIGAVALFAIATAAGAAPHRLLTAVLGGLATGAVYLVMVFVTPRGMGLGDAKLALLTGLVTGWFGAWAAFYGFFLGMLLAGLVGVVLLASRRVRRRDAIPIGPFMLVGALAAILLIA